MKKKYRGVLSIVLIVTLILVNTLGFSNMKTYAMTSNVLEKIKINDLNKEELDILIYFEEKVGPEEELKKFTSKTQKRVIALLEDKRNSEKVDFYQSFYIVNAINAKLKDKSLIYEIANLEEVVSIEENAIIEIDPIIEEREKPYFTYREAKLEDEYNWVIESTNAKKVWDEYNIDGSGIVIGILDSGVNYKLDSLKEAYAGYDKENDTFDNSYYRDYTFTRRALNHDNNTHGSMVASIIVGKKKIGDESTEYFGVAKGAKFISAKAIDGKYGSVSTVYNAGQWLLKMKPDIINNSWGGGTSRDYNIRIDEMIRNWHEAGIIAVFASGNELIYSEARDGNISFPASLDHVFSVGAIDKDDVIWSRSQRGPADGSDKIKPDVVSYGVKVDVINQKGETYISNGTSFAAPIVAGIIAMIKQAKSDISADEIYDLLRKEAIPLSDDRYQESPNMAYGYGKVDAYKIISSLLNKDAENNETIENTENSQNSEDDKTNSGTEDSTNNGENIDTGNKTDKETESGESTGSEEAGAETEVENPNNSENSGKESGEETPKTNEPVNDKEKEGESSSNLGNDKESNQEVGEKDTTGEIETPNKEDTNSGTEESPNNGESTESGNKLDKETGSGESTGSEEADAETEVENPNNSENSGKESGEETPKTNEPVNDKEKEGESSSNVGNDEESNQEIGEKDTTEETDSIGKTDTPNKENTNSGTQDSPNNGENTGSGNKTDKETGSGESTRSEEADAETEVEKPKNSNNSENSGKESGEETKKINEPVNNKEEAKKENTGNNKRPSTGSSLGSGFSSGGGRGSLGSSKSSSGGGGVALVKNKPAPENKSKNLDFTYLLNNKDSLVKSIVNAGVWKKLNNEWYLYNGNAALKDTLANIDGKWYFLAKDGKMKTEWLNILGEWYYFLPDGSLLSKQWLNSNGEWYYLNEDAKMVKAWLKIGEIWYYFLEDGRMLKNAWLKYKDKWYYFNSKGEMLKSTNYLGYSFDKDGAMIEK